VASAEGGAAWSCGAVEFAAALDRIAAAAKSPLLGPVAGVLADAGAGTVRLHGDDGRQTITAEVAAEVAAAGSLVVSHDILAGLLRGLTGGAAFAAGGDALAVEAEGARATLRMAPGLALPDPPPPPGGGVAVAAAALRRAIVRAEKSAEPDGPRASRPVLAGLWLQERDGRLWVAAADGYRLALAAVGAGDWSALALPAVLPGGPARALARLLAGCGEAGTVRLATDGDGAWVAADGWSWSCRLVGGAPPDVWQVLADRPEQSHAALLDREGLRRAVEAAAWFAGASRADHGHGGAIVRLGLGPGGCAVAAKDADRGEAERRVAGSVEGEAVEIKLGADYLRDALAAMEGDEVEISVAGPRGAVVLREAGGGPDRWLVMPML